MTLFSSSWFWATFGADGLDVRFFCVQETRLNGFRSPMEFFDFNRLSRPADFSTAVSVSLAHLAFVPIGMGSALY